MNASSVRTRENWHPTINSLLFVAGLLVSEAVLASLLFDGTAIATHRGDSVLRLIVIGAPWFLRWLIVFTTLTATILYVRADLRPRGVVTRTGVSRGFAVAHVASAGAVVALSVQLYGSSPSRSGIELLAIGWLASLSATAATAFLAVIPLRAIADVVRPLRAVLLGSCAAAFLACVAGQFARTLWEPTRYLTFSLVRWLLSLFVTDVVSIADKFEIGTSRFTVLIAAECSGLEGLGLLLVFGILWWILFGSSLGLVRSLALFALAAVTLYVLNAVRIVALLLIGHAGAQEVALGGFHSQAGWISFATVAFGLTLVGRRMSDATELATVRTRAYNPAAPLLIPFLAFLAAGMAASAFSGRFEWLYGLRVAGAAAALWHFRKAYKTIAWRVRWHAPVIGAAVFVLWIGLEWLLRGGISTTGAPVQFRSADPPVQALWLALRIIGATMVVPLVEELAFRGFLLRRFVSAEFESVSFTRWTAWAVLASSVLFGALHAERWIAGTLAGGLYAWAMVRHGSLGDAVVAHAVTNAMLAVFVLYSGAWHLW